jgi:hypothetical protein
MFWIVFISLVLLIIGLILVAPIYLRIIWNETNQQLQLSWGGVLNTLLVPFEEEAYLQISFLFFKKKWLLPSLITASPKSSKPRTKKSKSWRPKHPLKVARRLWESFHLLQFRLNIDTDDYVWNAYLYPVFHSISSRKKMDWTINFEGQTELLLVIENRLFRILYALFR